MEFGAQKVAAGLLEALPAVPEMAPEMALEMEQGTALSNQWVSSFPL